MVSAAYGECSFANWLTASKAHLGISDNVVTPGRREERKSVGVERTFRDKTDDQEIMDTLTDIAEELHKDMENLQYAGKTVTVKYKLHTFESRFFLTRLFADHVDKTRAQSVKRYISTKDEILPVRTLQTAGADGRSQRSFFAKNYRYASDYWVYGCRR